MLFQMCVEKLLRHRYENDCLRWLTKKMNGIFTWAHKAKRKDSYDDERRRQFKTDEF